MENKKIKELVESLRRGHSECGDSWYSCPKHEHGSADDSKGDDCDCGADYTNAIVDQILAILDAQSKPVEGDIGTYRAMQNIDGSQEFWVEWSDKAGLCTDYRMKDKEDTKRLASLLNSQAKELTTAKDRVEELEGYISAHRIRQTEYGNTIQQLREALEDIASTDKKFCDANGGYYGAINAIIGRARQALGSDSKGEVIEGHDMEGPTRESTPTKEDGKTKEAGSE